MIAACSGGSAHAPMDMAMGPDLAKGPPPIGSALTVPNDQWTWVDFPDSSCDDGSTTGIGVYHSSTSSNLLVFMNGGGACWDYQTCYQLNTASHGPFQQAEFAQFASASMAGTIFDRSEAQNPFKDWSYVFIPYCTGDVHSGNNVIQYSMGTSTKTYHHTGHANVLAYLKRLQPTFPTPGKLVVSGSSAGGFGSLLNYATFRWYWPETKSYLLDDSGPPLENDWIPQGFVMSWLTNWNLQALLDDWCGDMCTTDLSYGVVVLTGAYPNDRMSLLSSLQDKTISGYFLLSNTGMQAALTQLATDRLDPTTNFHYFYVTGNTHTMLGDVASFTSNATPLWTWLGQQVNDDPAWASTGKPQ